MRKGLCFIMVMVVLVMSACSATLGDIKQIGIEGMLRPQYHPNETVSIAATEVQVTFDNELTITLPIDDPLLRVRGAVNMDTLMLDTSTNGSYHVTITYGGITLTQHFLVSDYLHVGEDKPFLTINEALDAAKSGDVIVVDGGIYEEALTIEAALSNITITGLEGATLSGDDTLVHVLGEGFTLQHFTVNAENVIGDAVVIDANDATFKYNTFQAADTAFAIRGGTDHFLYTNTFIDNALSIVIHEQAMDVTIKSNTITQTDGPLIDTGIHVYPTHGVVTLQENIIEKQATGLMIMGEGNHQLMIEESTFESNHLAIGVDQSSIGQGTSANIVFDKNKFLINTYGVDGGDDWYFELCKNYWGTFEPKTEEERIGDDPERQIDLVGAVIVTGYYPTSSFYPYVSLEDDLAG